MEGHPGWVISPMPGPPSRQHKHERQYTPSTHSVIPTRRIWNDDDDGQMIFGDLEGLKFPDICLTGEEKPRKSITQETCPDRGSNPGSLRDKLHSGGPIEGFISKVTYLQFFNIWSWAYQSITCTLFDGIHYVFCWKRRKYQFQEPLKVRVISNVTHFSAVFISKESYFVMANIYFHF